MWPNSDVYLYKMMYQYLFYHTLGIQRNGDILLAVIQNYTN